MSEVILFSGINYTNDMLMLKSGMHVLPESWVKKIVSVKVPANMRVRLYDDRNPSNSRELTENTPDLSVIRWSNRAIKVNVDKLSESFENVNKKENTKTCNRTSLLIFIIGILFGLVLSFIIKQD
jgi:hypothetical protein